jgi:hypothetical protein
MSNIVNWFYSPHIPTIYFPGSTLIVATLPQPPSKIQKFFHTKIPHALSPPPYILKYQTYISVLGFVTVRKLAARANFSIYIYFFVVCFPGVTTHCGCIFTAQ